MTSLKSLGFEMKSQVGESVEPSALVLVLKTFCPVVTADWDACVCSLFNLKQRF